MTRKILSWLALGICEAILIAAFILFRGETPTNVLVLNIVVATVILGLLFIDILRPWGDRHTSRIGSMGVRWTVVIAYAVLAVGAMIFMHARGASFATQLLVQGILLALLLLGMAAVLRTKEQIAGVHEEESAMVDMRDSVKQAWLNLLETMDQNPETPAELRGRVDRIVQDLRYLAPTNNPEAIATDRQLVEGAEALGRMTADYRLNNTQAEQTLARCERLLKQRRTQYSN